MVGCAGPADASARGGLKCAMAAITAFMSCDARTAAAYVRCSPSRGAGVAPASHQTGELDFQLVSTDTTEYPRVTIWYKKHYKP